MANCPTLVVAPAGHAEATARGEQAEALRRNAHGICTYAAHPGDIVAEDIGGPDDIVAGSAGGAGSSPTGPRTPFGCPRTGVARDDVTQRRCRCPSHGSASA